MQAEDARQDPTVISMIEPLEKQGGAAARFAHELKVITSGAQAESSAARDEPMVTLEDMSGTATILAMNESYEKYVDLFVANQPLLVTAEVSTGEDKPKLFPQEILRLDDAPRKFTKRIQLRMRSEQLQGSRLEELRSVMEAHKGGVPVYLCLRLPGGEAVWIEPNDRYQVMASRAFEEAVVGMFGEDAVQVKSDNSLPERAQRRWEKRGGGGDDE